MKGATDRAEFLSMLRERVLLLDGAYGSEFIRMGSGGRPGEALNLERPELVEALHDRYVEAGADILLANSFSANRPKLSEMGLADKLGDINSAAVRIARRSAAKASGRRVLVLGDLSSTGAFPAPMGPSSVEACAGAFAEQAACLAEAGCDGIIVETMTDIKELKAAVIGVRSVAPGIPLIAHMAFDASGRSLTGADVEAFAALMNDLDVDVLGMNCDLGPEEMVPVLARLGTLTRKPLSAEPNAGKPWLEEGRTIYRLGPESFGPYVEDLADAGASIIGGCCGTTPAHIAVMRSCLGAGRPRPRRPAPPSGPSSRSRIAPMGDFLVVGERMNPASRPAFQEALARGDLAILLEEATSQAEEGALALDLNFGVERLVASDTVRSAVIELDRRGAPALSLDIQDLGLLETAMKECAGRPIVNSTTAAPEAIHAKAALLRTYGGMIVLLCLERKIPQTAAERVAVAMEGVRLLEAEGIGRDRILIDPLALAIGTGKDPRVTLDAIEALAKAGLRTTLGLSNLSFGMPDRSSINAAFLSQAVARDLSSAIMNPGEGHTMAALRGAVVIREGKVPERAGDEDRDPLVKALLSGKADKVVSIVDERAAATGRPGQEILGAAMEEVGALYEAKDVFLPQLLFAAETSYPVFERLNARAGGAAPTKGIVLLATVEGDIHDIGKSIIATVLRSAGYAVVDMGKDVPAARIAEAARAEAPLAVGLSAMMTTTVGRVAEVAALFKAEGLGIPLIAGGASMGERLAKGFGVAYAADGSSCLRFLSGLKHGATNTAEADRGDGEPSSS